MLFSLLDILTQHLWVHFTRSTFLFPYMSSQSIVFLTYLLHFIKWFMFPYIVLHIIPIVFSYIKKYDHATGILVVRIINCKNMSSQYHHSLMILFYGHWLSGTWTDLSPTLQSCRKSRYG